MRVFLCAFGEFYLAIPMQSVSSLALYTDLGAFANAVEYDEENRNTYVSLPRLFNLPLLNTRHSIVLKRPGAEDNGNGEDDDAAAGENDDNCVMQNRTVLLTSEVECEAEIPRAEIYPMPKVFGGTRFCALFSGIQFASRRFSKSAPAEISGEPVLFLNTGELVQSIQEERAL